MADRCSAADVSLARHRRMTIRAAPPDVRGALETVKTWLASAGVPAALAVNVEIALAETLNNIVEHAHAGMEPGQVTVRFRRTSGAVELELIDRGRAMPGQRLPAGAPPALAVPRDALPEGGFGWELIRAVSDSVSYRRENGENRHHLRFALSGDAAGPESDG